MAMSPRSLHIGSLQHAAPITTSSAPPSTEPKPKTIESGTSGKRKRPLTAEQERFLDSAVRLNYLDFLSIN
jgi:ubiquinone biosynthesis monooxygenase Coq7